MQYLKEMPNGNRVPVTPNQWLIDKYEPRYHQIIATMGLTIYKVARVMGGKAPKPLRYGGRGRADVAWNGG